MSAQRRGSACSMPPITLGYSPNQSGRSLRQGATGMIGFMVATDSDRAAKGEAFFM